VTERRLAEEKMRAAREEAEKANRAKSEFLSRMSHELRTPLNAILGFAQLLERKELPSLQTTWVRHILGAGQHLLSLIDEILDVSRIETGQMRLSLEPVRVREVLDEVQDLMQPVADQHEVKLLPVQWDSQSEYVTADRQRIKQVVLNLMSNAVKYNRPGGWVQMSVSPGSDNEMESVRISVADNGAGIEEDFLERVFVPFDRLGHQNSAVPGTGLGLSLSKYLVEAMGGKIGVVSARGEGCTAWIEIPLSDDPFQGAELDVPLLSEVNRPERTLLYIEDNPANLKLVEHLLQAQAGVHLVTASHGALGLELARRHHPDLIILDLHLPDVMGWEILHQLRSDDATRDIPVIVLSADTTASQRSRLLEAGADRYLTKPINASNFLNTLEEVMA
jgi:CheY-like chemotaxis protein